MKISSQNWVHHFQKNSERGIPEFATATLSTYEKSIIGPSIAQFELGEGSDGKNLYKRAQQHAQKFADPEYTEAVELFIKEENFHSDMLEAFMKAEGIETIETLWLDNIFRGVRKLISLEVMITVLLTAEIVAMSYYSALSQASKSASVKKIGEIILTDETYHLQFQTDYLTRIYSGRSVFLAKLRNIVHSVFLTVSLFGVWKEHGRLFKLAGYSFQSLRSEAFGYLLRTNTSVLNAAR